VLEKTVLILGSGAYRIGSSVEFDWCAVHMGKALRQLGYTTAMLNYNPETVSTDYDESDVLFFDDISIENIHALHKRFAFAGIVVSVGGQIPNNLAMELHRQGIPILGTMAENIKSGRRPRPLFGNARQNRCRSTRMGGTDLLCRSPGFCR
jgi:carbamoyl-phosphate synthase large subunit